MSKPKKLLIITSSGGGGLIQTANAKQQEVLARDPNTVVIRRDLLKDWIWGPFGNYCINFWNEAQLKGNVLKQSLGVRGQFLLDYFLHPIIFCYALYTCFKEDVDHVIDTQPLGTSAIIKALRIFNRKKGKQVCLEKVLVDLPTKKATHFFRPIKKLSKKNRKFLKLTTIVPLLEEGETAEEFWQKTCGLSEKEINLEDVYVRQAFLKYKGMERTLVPMQTKIRYKTDEELALGSKIFQKGSIQSAIREGEVEFKIEPEDWMVTILLGSQPANQATVNYVKKWADIARSFPAIRIHLFVFSADHKRGEQTLFQRVVDAVEGIADYPKNLTVIPFPFQSDEAIAPLFYRSDVTCTRSGGQTAMELMCVSTGEIWIHSEAKEGQDLIQGIPCWEAASAVYLQKLHGARLVTPDTFTQHAHRLFEERTLERYVE